jgi:nucleotide-binding universal stress UspA family protein
MTQLRRIIVGHNFFPDGEVAVRSAVALAERSGAEILLTHIVEPFPLSLRMGFPTVPAQKLLEEAVSHTHDQLTDLAARSEYASVRIEVDTHQGKPFVELITTCRHWHADLIVVGAPTHDLDRFLGSTTERVVRKASTPVLVAKQPLAIGPKTILVPTDFSPASKPAAEEALTLVRGFGGRIIFVHVLDLSYIYPVGFGGEAYVPPPLTVQDFELDWQAFLSDLPLGGGLVWEKQTREGHAAQTITEIAAEVEADLVVIGTHGRTGLAHILLGSVAERVIRTTACSVLTVRPDGFRFELP